MEAGRLLSRMMRRPDVWVFLVSLAVLSVYPIADCVGCEGPGAFGRDEATYERNSQIFAGLFVGAALLSGATAFRRVGFLPLAMGIPYVITQPSREDGLVVMILLGAPTAFVAILLGYVVRFVVLRYRMQ